MQHFLLANMLCSVAATLPLTPAAAQSTMRVSVDSAGAEAERSSHAGLAISADGRFAAFKSSASNLVPGDTNGNTDVFVHDAQTGQTVRVSVDGSGNQGSGYSVDPSISADGRYVAFWSMANNLVPGDTNATADVFVHDRLTGATTRVSLSSAGQEANGLSSDPSISADGRYVAFSSEATNLVLGDTNFREDVFVHDRQSGQTTRVSIDSAGIQGDDRSILPSISADGSAIAFFSHALNLVAADTNGWSDIFVHDRQSGLTQRVSVDAAGVQADSYNSYPQISADSRFVIFDSHATNLVPFDTNQQADIFVHDRQTGQIERVNVDSAGQQSNLISRYGAISADGRIVAFSSHATNLVAGDTNGWPDVFVRDRQTGVTERVSVNTGGVQGNRESTYLEISADGGHVLFSSDATNLVPGDLNGEWDAFVHDRFAPGLGLYRTGSCPGPVTLTIRSASAGGRVAVLFGPAGTFVQPGWQCRGLTLNLSSPTLAALATADGSGTAVLSFSAPAGGCGLTIQAVDLASCTPTNVIVL